MPQRGSKRGSYGSASSSLVADQHSINSSPEPDAFSALDENTPLLAKKNDLEQSVIYSDYFISSHASEENSVYHEDLSETMIANSFVMHSVFHEAGATFAPQYESLDYDVCENTLFLEEQKNLGRQRIKLTNLMRWVIAILIGILTALSASVIVISVERLSHFKYSAIGTSFDNCEGKYCLLKTYAIWLALNAVPSVIGSLLVTYIAPVAAGSGIPVIKCYLNGVKVPEVVRFSTFIVKLLGVILSVVGGLAVGKEGPMIHCGSIIAAGISQGKSTTFRKDFKVLESFREDHEKRDFVSAGAAAGVAAAFGAPLGGVLFSLEEGASFWNQVLTWRIFLCSMTSVFTLNMVLSAYHHHPGELSYSGLINFGKFNNVSYSFYEVPVYVIMGIIGGLTGALFDYLNYRITLLRMKYLTSKWMKVLEVAVVAMVTASVGFLMVYYSEDNPTPQKHSNTTVYDTLCEECRNNSMRALWFQTPEQSVRSMFHDPPDTWSPQALGTFAVVYFFLACWTYGLSVSSGLFIPTLLCGATWGRLIAVFCAFIFGPQTWISYGKFSVIGAAVQLGGVVRMTLSLTVILIEATGNITLGFPVMFSLMITKWVADYTFHEGIYDMHIRLSRVPLLGWEPPQKSHTIYASKVMSRPVVTFRLIENVGRIIDVLTSTTHNGFPVVDVDEDSPTRKRTYGRLRGLILRSQLIVLLQHKAFNETAENLQDYRKLTMKELRDAYPRYSPIEQIHISPRERNFTIDLRPYMNPSPYAVLHTASFPRIFRPFRALGLRHLVVVNDRNEVVGIVTRKSLAKCEDIVEESLQWQEQSRTVTL